MLDFSWSLPGPYASRMLVDLGAEVDAVDFASRPEIFRTLPPLCGADSYAWLAVNRGKRRRTIDHRSAAEITALKAEIEGYDVLIEQFRPGAMAGMGLGYDVLSKSNPRLIYCSISGYGQTGDRAGRAGHDINYLALSGVADGMRGGGEPALSALPFADLAGGSLHAVIGILAALQQRNVTGRGGHIDVSMMHTMWALNALVGPAALNGHAEPPGTGLLDGGTFYGYYRTRDDRFFAVGGIEPKFIHALFGALDRPELIPFALDGSNDGQRTIRRALEDIFITRDFAQWRDFFACRDLCVDPVLNLEEAAALIGSEPSKVVAEKIFGTEVTFPMLSIGLETPAPRKSS